MTYGLPLQCRSLATVDTCREGRAVRISLAQCLRQVRPARGDAERCGEFAALVVDRRVVQA